MKIQSLSVKYSTRNICIQDVEFNNGLSLLVGVSGVGKTQILDAICDIKQIALGEAVNAFSWDITFSLNEDQYLWSGEFGGIEIDALTRVKNFFKDTPSGKSNDSYIIREDLYLNNEKIIQRQMDQIIFDDKETVKLPQNESCISLLKQERKVNPVNQAFQKIKLITTLDERPLSNIALEKNLANELSNFDALRNLSSLNHHILEKLYLCQTLFDFEFNEIKDAYTEIFPFVTDLDIVKTELNLSIQDNAVVNQFMFRIKEDGVENWIYQEEMSSGMKKVLFHIAYLSLSPKGTIFLIDEFENGFGVNCIDAISHWIMNPALKYQFIITSHHPYIINAVPSRRWKIVTRHHSIIQAYEATDYLDSSHHEAFIKLINLPIYKLGASANIDK